MNANAAGEDHYLRKLKNLIDGLDQERRKQLWRGLGLKEANPTLDEAIERLKDGALDFGQLLKEVKAEKLPGCGSMVIVATCDEAREVTEEMAQVLLKELHRECYTYTTRSGYTKGGNDR